MDSYVFNKKKFFDLCFLQYGGNKKNNLPNELLKKQNARKKAKKESKKIFKKKLARSTQVIHLIDKNDIETFCEKINKEFVMKKSLDFFVGKEVYIKFEIKNKGYNIPIAEWIWVKIKSVNRDKNCLIGSVDVNPRYLDEIKFNDEICVKQKDIGMIQIIDLVNFFMGLIDHMKNNDIDKYYDAIFEYIKSSNLDGSFY